MILPALTALVVAAPPAPEPPVLDFTRHDGTPRIVLIGDTGMPGPIVDRWRKALAAKDEDAIIVLGDLVYEQAPPCPKGVPDLTARRVLDSHLAKALEGLSVPPDLFGNPAMRWSATNHLGSTATRLSQLQGGRWKLVLDYDQMR